MANAGGLWDNAKKFVEAGNFGGKRSDTHKATVIGDTVGDPFKDAAGPSLNTLVTVMSQIASLFAPLIIAYAARASERFQDLGNSVYYWHIRPSQEHSRISKT
jgi:K(+)-stimulated pyrophosphate-energized sodium pump